MSGLLSPDTGYFRLFSLFSSWRASARLHLKKKKFLEIFSVAGACSFHGANFCHNDKEAAVNTVVFTRFLRKLGRKSARQNRWEFEYHQPWIRFTHSEHFFLSPRGCKKTQVFLQPLCLLQIDFYKVRFSLIVPLWEPLCPLCMRALR